MHRAKNMILFALLCSALPMLASALGLEVGTKGAKEITQYTSLWDRAGRWTSAQIAGNGWLRRSAILANKAARWTEAGTCTASHITELNNTLLWRDTIIRDEARKMLLGYGLDMKEAADTAARIHWCSDRVGNIDQDHIGGAGGHWFVRFTNATVDLRPKGGGDTVVDIEFACRNEHTHIKLFPDLERAKIRKALTSPVEDLASGKEGKKWIKRGVGATITTIGLAAYGFRYWKQLRSKA